jgi:hypothetical protein
MHKWMQSAAGGTSQRLKPAVAIVRSLSRNPAPAPGTLPALLIVVIAIFPCSPLLKRVFLCRLRSHCRQLCSGHSAHPAVPRHSGMREIDKRTRETQTFDAVIAPAALPAN